MGTLGTHLRGSIFILQTHLPSRSASPLWGEVETVCYNSDPEPTCTTLSQDSVPEGLYLRADGSWSGPQ